MNKFKIETYNILRELQIPAHIKGYEFLKSALLFLQTNPESIHAMMKELYPGVAKMHKDCMGPSVERGIRTAIRASRVDDETWLRIMGRARPFSNSEFIATVNEVIKLKLASEEC